MTENNNQACTLSRYLLQRLQEAGIPLAGLTKGSHQVKVTATRSNGMTGADTIKIIVQ